MVGGVARLLGCAFLCAVLAAAAPADAAYRQTFADLSHFIRARKLPAPLTRRLRGFFKHTQRLEAATRYDLLLTKMSGKLRSDTAGAMASGLLARVPYFMPPPPPPTGAAAAGRPRTSLLAPPTGLPEAKFLASVVLALEPRLQV